MNAVATTTHTSSGVRRGAKRERDGSGGMGEERLEKGGGFIREADDLVRGLTIELEVELGLGPTVLPVGEALEVAAAEATLRQRDACHRDADARRLPRDPGLIRNRFSRRHDAACDQARTALVFACEDKDRIALADVLAAVHGLLLGECECLCAGVADLGFDREHRAPLTPAGTVTLHRCSLARPPAPGSRRSPWPCACAESRSACRTA